MPNRDLRVSVGVTSSGRTYLAESRGITAGADAAGAGGGGAGGVTDDFLNQGGGPVLRDVQLQPVFWGKGWASRTEPFTVSDMVGQLRTMAATPYLSDLAQYGCTGTVTVRDALIWDDDAITTTTTKADRDSTINDRLLNLIDSNALPEPDEAAAGLVYVLVLSSASFLPVADASGNPTVVGGNGRAMWSDNSELLTGDYDTDQAVHWFWVGVPPPARLQIVAGGTYATPLEYATKVASHELVEKMTDPGPDHGVRNQITTIQGDTQIGDPQTCNFSAAVVDGVAVQPYWSQQAAGGQGAPVLPHRVRNTFPSVLKENETTTPGDHQETQQTVLCPIARTMTIGFTPGDVTQSYRVDARPTGFDNPVATFTIFGQQLTTTAGNISGNLSVTPPGQPTGSATVTMSFSITGNVITVTNVTFDGSFELPIGIDVTEKNLDQIPVPVHATGTATVPFATKVRTLDPGSQDALEQCAREAARFHAGALQQEILKLPLHDGDPGPIIERIQELYRQLIETRVRLRALRLARGSAFGAGASARGTPTLLSAGDSTSE